MLPLPTSVLHSHGNKISVMDTTETTKKEGILQREKMYSKIHYLEVALTQIGEQFAF